MDKHEERYKHRGRVTNMSPAINANEMYPTNTVIQVCNREVNQALYNTYEVFLGTVSKWQHYNQLIQDRT